MASIWLAPTTVMRIASLHAPPEAGISNDSGAPIGEGGGAAPAATGPQRALEASSFIGPAPAERMDAAFEALPNAAIVAFRDGSDLLLNARARALLGLGEAERIRSIEDLHTHVRMTVNGDVIEPPLSRALTGEQVSVVVRATVHDADDRCWSIDAAPMRQDAMIVGAVCTLRDVTERLLDDEMGDDLLGRASHDLRTPLTALKASAQLIGRGFERLDPNARQRTLGLLLAQIDKLAARIDEVMDASRIRRGRIDVDPRDANVTEVLREIVAELSTVPGMPKCELRADEGLLARTDPARLRQIVRRLVSDAASRGTERIALEAVRSEAGVTITVDVQGERVEDGRTRTARRLAATILQRLGGEAREDRLQRLVLTLPAPSR